MTASDAMIEVEGATMRYGATLALDRVSVTVAAGRTHAIVGENGAGKSTLGKILAGVAQPDAGALRIRGADVRFTAPRDALRSGITMIAQELTLVPQRTVADNVFLGSTPSRAGVVRRPLVRDRYRRLTADVGFELDPDRRVHDLSVAERQQVEILRAVARNADAIVMDEPTAALSRPEALRLFAVVRRLNAAGTAVIYISHFLDDVLELADVVTIMRDGRVIRTSAAAKETRDTLVEAMIGAPLETSFPERQKPSTPTIACAVSGLSRAPHFHDVSFDVRVGEIVALAGLVGSGRSEVARCLFGADRPDSGHVELLGRELNARTPRQAIRRGVAMVPESRKDDGLVLDRSVRDNLTLVHADHVAWHGLRRDRVADRLASAAAERVHVTTRSMSQLLTLPVRALSGGNQQKVVIAKWLLRDPTLLIVDEPTRGIDVGAKRAVYDVLRELADAGTAVLLISSELEEVLGLANRIVVLAGGRVTGRFDGAAATEDDIMRAAFDHTAAGGRDQPDT